MPVTADWSHETSLPAGPRSAALARDFVRLQLLAHHLPHLVEDVRVVVSELATNAVVHARTAFVVTLSSSSGTVLLEIEDSSTSQVLLRTADPLSTSGRGLVIVTMLSRQWGTRTDAAGLKTVWASFSGEA